MKFEFKLQTVLTVKENFLKQTQQDLAKLFFKKNECTKEIRAIEQKIINCSTEIEKHQNFSPKNIKFEYDYYHELINLKKYKEEEISIIELEINSKREELNWQNKEIKALETLKDKKLKEYQEIINKQEQANLDEIALHQNNPIL